MNVTISLPEELVREARHQAIDRGVSLSRYIADLLAERVGHARGRDAAAARLRELMETGFDLDLANQDWTRDDLHRR